MAYESRGHDKARPREGALSAGVFAGFIAGMAMALTAMFHSLSVGLGFWLPMKMIASLFLGVDALVQGAGAVMLGFVIHMIISAVYGVIFSSLVDRGTSTPAAFWGGLAYGIAVWVVMTYIALPIFDTVMQERVALMPGWWFFDHLVFGAFLSVTPALRARRARRLAEGRPSEPPRVRIPI